MKRSVFLLKSLTSCRVRVSQYLWIELDGRKLGNEAKPGAGRQTQVMQLDFEQQIGAWDGTTESGTRPAGLSLLADAVSPATFPVLSPKFKLSVSCR